MFASSPEVAPATTEGVVFQASQRKCSAGMLSGILNAAQQSLRHKDTEEFRYNFFKQTHFVN